MSVNNDKFIPLYFELLNKSFFDVSNVCFSYAKVRVTVITNLIKIIKWINNYFCDYFNFRSNYITSVLHPKIYIVADYKYFNKFNKFNSLPKSFSINKFFSKTTNDEVLCIVDKKRKNIIILSNDESDLLKYTAMRVVRDLVCVLLQNKNYVFFHCACLSKRHQALGIIGNSGSGKTTALINIIKNRDFNFLSNDKIALTVVNKRLEALGFPIAIGIRKDTLNKCIFPKKKFDLKSEKSEKIFFHPKAFTNLLNTSIEPSANIKFFIIPEYYPTLCRSKLVQLSKKKAFDFLCSQKISSAYEEQKILENFINTQNNNIKRTIRLISDRTPFYRLMHNGNFDFLITKLLKDNIGDE